MKVRVTFEIDSSSGDYEVLYENLSAPGKPIDFRKVSAALRRVLSHHVPAVEGGQMEEGLQ